jgi:pilus assembly protein CpaF
MSLMSHDPFIEEGAEARRRTAIAPPSAQRMSDSYQAVKALTCQQVIEQLEAQGSTAETLDQRMLRHEIEQVINSRRRRGQLALNSAERLLLIEDVEDEVVGLGPLAPLLRDTTIDDIIVNGANTIYVERAGMLEKVDTRFRDDAHLMNIIQRIVGPIGRRVDEATPFVDARLADGSRVNIVIPPVALDGPTLSIRKFRMQQLSLDDCVATGVMSAPMADYLGAAVRSRLNVLICGGTGAGKSTLLNVLSSCIDDRERLVTIEDAAELQLRQGHVVRLETRPPNVDGNREVSARDLLRNALRMRPDRIILGEVRGVEAVEMLQAMSTGHDGSMATLHGNSPRDALARLEMLLGFAGQQNDVRAVRRFVANSIHVIVNIQRLANGSRRVTAVAEVTGVEGDTFTLNDLFRFDEQPVGSGQGEFRTLSPRPYHAARLRERAPAPRAGDTRAEDKQAGDKQTGRKRAAEMRSGDFSAADEPTANDWNPDRRQSERRGPDAPAGGQKRAGPDKRQGERRDGTERRSEDLW